MDEEGITLDYPSQVRVDSIRAVCFGGGEASFGAAVRTDSAWSAIDPVTLICDGEPHTVPLAAPLEHINAIRLNGRVEDGAGALIAAALTGATQ